MCVCVCTDLVLVVEFVVGDVCRQIGVKYGTESEPIIPAAAEVGDVNVLCACGGGEKRSIITISVDELRELGG